MSVFNSERPAGEIQWPTKRGESALIRERIDAIFDRDRNNEWPASSTVN